MKKQQIINGVIRYIKETLVNQIPDTFTKRIVCGFADLMAMKPDVFDKILEKYPFMELFEANGTYDIDLAEDLLRKNINEYGNITLNIMGASFTFTATDISDLKEAIER